MARLFSIALFSSVAAAVASMSVGTASGHTLLTNPTPRDNNDGLKTGPCGNVARTSTPMEVNAGDSITVGWLETVNHPGYYRLALSLDGDTGFDDNVLADNIADTDCAVTPCDYSQEITIPDVECENCTLQIIQYMGNAAPYRPYFSCADLRISGDGGGQPDAGSAGNGEDGSAGGGCSMTSGAGAGGLATLLLVCLVLGYVYSGRKPRK